MHAEKLAEVDRMKSQFFTNISHEFRTPLTLIKGPAKLIIDEAENKKIKDNAILIDRYSEKLNRLVTQVLDLSKLEAGEMDLKTRPVNIISILNNSVQSFISYAERKKITLSFNSNIEEILVYLDKDKVEKIINNILSNAFIPYIQYYTDEAYQATVVPLEDIKKRLLINISVGNCLTMK